MADEETHGAAIIAALEALGAEPFDIDKLPSPLPDYYTEVSVSRRYGGEALASSELTSKSYRITTRQVAKTITNARRLRAKGAGLEDTLLTVGGDTTSPVAFETEDLIGPDDGWYSGLQTWTYAL